jgi:hypothetical protein
MFRFVVGYIVAAVVITWGLNILGDSAMFNDPEIWYGGKDPATGKVVATQGCRPERVKADGSCDKSFRIIRNFPSF